MCNDWASDWGSEVVREASGRVNNRFRYRVVIWSWTRGTGRWEAEVSK